MEFDIVVVGAGFAGSIIAREAANAGKRVLVLERRAHIAGNMYDYINSDGILVQKYGPHSFHTKDRQIYDYVSLYAKMVPYRLKSRALIGGKMIPCPFNLTSIEMLYPENKAKNIIARLKSHYPGKNEVAIFELLNSDDAYVREYAKLLFTEDFRPYTAKQWGRRPEDVDESVIRRVPVLLDRRDSYFDDEYECQPDGGYTKLFENMLSHPRITLKMNEDALDHIKFEEDAVLFDGNADLCVIYSGAIDELFRCRFGALPYRSLYFEWQTLKCKSFQEVAMVAYPKDPEITRITEYTKLPYQYTEEKTVIAKEYPLDYVSGAEKGGEPYYPIANADNFALRDRYLDLAKGYKNLKLCGRLADYKYYNMEDVIKRALEVAEKEINIRR